MKLAENTVVHCPTLELVKKVLHIANKAGYKWCDGKSYIKDDKWDKYEEGTCYNFITGQYADLLYYKDTNYNIISAEEFLKDNRLIKDTKLKNMKYFLTKSVTISNLNRDITIAVFSEGTNLHAGYSVRNPIDEEMNIEKAKTISTGRAFNDKTNLLKGETLGSLNHRYILKAIAENLLREIELGNIIIKGIR